MNILDFIFVYSVSSQVFDSGCFHGLIMHRLTTVKCQLVHLNTWPAILPLRKCSFNDFPLLQLLQWLFLSLHMHVLKMLDPKQDTLSAMPNTFAAHIMKFSFIRWLPDTSDTDTCAFAPQSVVVNVKARLKTIILFPLHVSLKEGGKVQALETFPLLRKELLSVDNTQAQPSPKL